MEKDYINYPKIIDEAMHNAVRKILEIISLEGIHGEHHFFISFLTNAPGVKLSDRIKARYPKEITIVLQYQFEELNVHEKFFSLRLSFDGISEVVVVPYEAITIFQDAGAKFGLQFNYYANNTDEIHDISAKENEVDSDVSEISDNVIVLDKFRKNKK